MQEKKARKKRQPKATPKQTAFAIRYAATGNLAQSYLDAYDSKGSRPHATEAGRRELKKPYISRLVQKYIEAANISAEQILVQLSEDRSLAYAVESPAAAVQASMAMAKVGRVLPDDTPSVQVTVDNRTQALIADLSSEKLQAIASLAESQVEAIDSTDVLDNGNP